MNASSLSSPNLLNGLVLGTSLAYLSPLWLYAITATSHDTRIVFFLLFPIADDHGSW